MLKSLLRGAVFGLGALCTLAIAQNITSSVQLSQDQRGIFGVDVNNNLYLQRNTHLLSPVGGPSTTVGTCGTSPSVIGTDIAGKVTTGSSATTSCVVTFGTAFVTAPSCVVSPDSTMAVTTAVSGVSTTTTLTVTYTSSTSAKFDYVCISTT